MRRWIAGLMLASGMIVGLASAQKKEASVPFHNPILFADYSDPDVIADGGKYYLVASTFQYVPGIPILESTDLVHWTILGHAVDRVTLAPQYDLVDGNRYGAGIWAPAIRKHNGTYFIYFPTPDEGIFVTTAKSIHGPWSKPVAVIAQAKLEDPCPFWDDDGNAYLIHSRKGAGPLILHRMSPDGLHVLDEGKVIVDDPKNLHTLEGPKMYKRNGWYYIFAPYGGVGTGAQVVMRSKNVWGPYDYRTVLTQGNTDINGPHQGGYIETPDGKGWFIHFQKRDSHGRILHLQPVRWENDWPIMGDAPAGATQGTPVASGEVTVPVASVGKGSPQTSDEFTAKILGPQWEWNHNPDNALWSLTKRSGYLSLTPSVATDLFAAHNTLTQQMQDNNLEATVRLDVTKLPPSGHAGFSMFEKAAGGIEITANAQGKRQLFFFHGSDRVAGPELAHNVVELRITVHGDMAAYSYSTDNGATFQPLGAETKMTFSWWKGARPAIFAYRTSANGDAGRVDVDWFHYKALNQ